MAKYNDLDMTKWKEYEDIYTDTLWLIDKRDNSGAHSGHYHGNFVPQIPSQLLKRYTKKGEWILDPFAGSGTSIIEAQRLGRNSIGIELQQSIADEAMARVETELNPNFKSNIYVGDSRNIDITQILMTNDIDKVQFVILHPPYWDIVKFSEDTSDLSNSESLEQFLENLDLVIDNTCKHLEKDRYCAIVIGDKYANSQVIPLGFQCMNLFLQKGYILKATLVKNFEDTKGKSNKKAIWRYRAMANDFYIFKHEYIFIFKKVKQ